VEEKKLTRRTFLKTTAMVAVSALAASCSQPEPEPTAAPAPTATTAAAMQATEVPMAKYTEAPMLAAKVASGALPSVEDRLPENPHVAAPTELWGWKGEIGQYGGTWKMASKGPGDNAWWGRIAYSCQVLMWSPDFTKAEVLPGLASSWEISPDGKAFTFTLRKGAKWSDGAPITSANVKWYYDNVLNNEELTVGAFPSWLRQGDDNSECTVSDDHTFTITFEKPNGFFIWDLCQYQRFIIVYFSHYMEQFHKDFVETAALDKLVADAKYEDWTQLYNAKAAFNDQTSEAPNYAPWTMTQRVGAGEHVLWERNPYFWMVDTEGQQLPYIDVLDGKVHQSLDTMVLDAVAGEVDNQSRHLSAPANIPVYEENKDKGGYHLTEQTAPDGPTQVNLCLSMTTNDEVKRELFRTKDFKLALSHAIDREEMWGLVWRGVAEFSGPKWDSPLQQDEFDAIYEDAAKFDLDMANQMLDDLGLKERDGEGFRLMKDGRRLSILMEGSVTYEVKAQVLELVSQYWAKVGVEGIVKTWDRPLFQDKRSNDECELCSHGDPGKGGQWTVGLMVDGRMDAPVHWEADYGHRWYTWYIDPTDPEGEEPPDDVKQALELYTQVKETPNFMKQVELYKQIMMIRANGFWWIDLGPYWLPAITFCVTKNDMQNVPPQMPGSWPWLTPGPAQTWMFYFDPPRA
jgi:peptide/nickel transport system substrate-binding protein